MMRSDYGYSEGDHLGKPYDLKLLKRLWPFLRPYGKLLVGSLVLVVAITLLNLAIPYITKVAIDHHIVPSHGQTAGGADRKGEKKSRYFIVDASDSEARRIVAKYPQLFESDQDRSRVALEKLDQLAPEDLAVLRQPDLDGLNLVVLLFLAAVLADFLFVFLQKMIMEYTGHKVMHDLRLRLYNHIQQQSMVFFTRQSVARLVTRVTNDVQNMHELFTTFIALVFKDLFLLVGIATVLLLLDWRLALAGFSVLPLVVWAAVRFANKARDVFRALRVKVAEINTRMSESIEGIRTIQTFCREEDNYRDFAELNAANYRLGMRQIHIFAVFMPMIEVVGIVSTAVVVFYGGLHVLGEQISLGVLVAALSYMRMFFRPLRDLAENYNILQNAMASAERLFDLLDGDERLPQIAPPKRVTAPAVTTRTALELNNVSFSYLPGEKVLDRISFDAAKGQTVAIVGPTGAGKTSVLNLIMRLYDAESGQVSLYGQPVQNWDLGRMRSLMALVPQEPMLVSGTLRQNIFPEHNGSDHNGPEHHGPDHNEMDQAYVDHIVSSANCNEIVARLAQGLDTPLAKSGAGLSSGERQLVSIARALARDPQIILLDEATSYIDSQTEAAIHKALDNLTAGRTCILVAHRLSTARTADKIVVLRHGRVEEQGSHLDLMAARGLYWRLNQQADETILGKVHGSSLMRS
ncbi:MAG: ABC transporter ATP-binding protein [Desulfobacteraceae bacterium]|jgi:ATP-binding cassette subfamily B protein